VRIARHVNVLPRHLVEPVSQATTNRGSSKLVQMNGQSLMQQDHTPMIDHAVPFHFRLVPRTARPVATVLPSHTAESRVSPGYNILSGELLDEQFRSLDRLIAEYVRDIPPLTRSDVDTEQFVDWMQDRNEVDAGQRDSLLHLCSTHAVETTSLSKRLAHARFAESLAKTPDTLESLTPASKAVVRLNPTHVWATFQTRVSRGEHADLPASVLFYQVGHEVRKAELQQQALRLVQVLEHQEMRVSKLFSRLNAEQSVEMMKTLVELAEQKIISVCN